jgi:hypothetical protein
MVRDFREELALAQKYDLDPISPEEYAVREAAADEKQGGFQVWRDADDAVIRFMDRAQLASIIAGAVASFLVKAEVSAFNLNELTASDPLTLRPANHQGDGPVRARWSGTRPDGRLAAVLARPGLWLQKLTTSVPADDQIDVAISSLVVALDEEQFEEVSSRGELPATAIGVREAAQVGGL